MGAKVEIIEGIEWAEHGQRIRERTRRLESQGKRVYIGRVGDESRLGRYLSRTTAEGARASSEPQPTVTSCNRGKVERATPSHLIVSDPFD